MGVLEFKKTIGAAGASAASDGWEQRVRVARMCARHLAGVSGKRPRRPRVLMPLMFPHVVVGSA